MKSLVTVLLLIVGSCWLLSCHTAADKAPPATLETMVTGFAQLECRAIMLRDKRFYLANQIRFTQDTLMHAASASDTVRLNENLNRLGEERERTTQQSVALADSIKHTLDSLMTHHLTTKEAKDQFTEMLHTQLESMHCTDSVE